MEFISCYNCGSRDSGPYATENGFSLVKCSRCGLLYVNPRPSEAEIGRAHRLGVHRGTEQFDITGTFNDDKVSRFLSILRDVFQNPTRLKYTSWLDIGCGHGEFLVALREFGGASIELRGIEPNTRKQQSARDRGLDVGDFSLESHPEIYDYLSLLNVYSHLPDPPTAFMSWRRLLKPAGHLLVETGDSAGLTSKDHHRPFYLPDHLSFASEAIVTDLLSRVGFEILDVFKYRYRRVPPWTFHGVSRELVKAILPHRTSMLRDMLVPAGNPRTDMYVLARRVD
jgi:SAM-dependent methyltransferase